MTGSFRCLSFTTESEWISGFRLDLLVEGRVVVEVKATEQIADVHRAQLLSYLRLGGYRLGHLLNFNVALMKSGVVRLLNGYPREAQ